MAISDLEEGQQSSHLVAIRDKPRNTSNLGKLGKPLLLETLQDRREAPLDKESFRKFLIKRHADESIAFYDAVQEFKTARDLGIANSISSEFVTETSPRQINISESLRKNTLDTLASLQQSNSLVGLPVDLFDSVEEEVLFLMEKDSFKVCIGTNSRIINKSNFNLLYIVYDLLT